MAKYIKIIGWRFFQSKTVCFSLTSSDARGLGLVLSVGACAVGLSLNALIWMWVTWGVFWRSAHVPTIPFTWLRREKALGRAAHAYYHHACMCLPHSRPQSPSFLGHVVGKRGALGAAVTDFLTSGCACAEVTNITAHAHNGFLSLTAPLGKKIYFLSSLQRVAYSGCFENAPLYSTWIRW